MRGNVSTEPDCGTPRDLPPRYRLVIFDMDGTLTEERLDFPAIRKAIGAPPNGGLLEHIARLPADEQGRALDTLHAHELAAAEICGVHEGAAEMLGTLKTQGIATALLTRNSAPCARTILSRHSLALDYIATREHVPHKPHPDSILRITRHFAISPQQTLMVGDYLYDLQAAQAAGTHSALYWAKRGQSELPAFANLATYIIETLREVPTLCLPGGPLT